MASIRLLATCVAAVLVAACGARTGLLGAGVADAGGSGGVAGAAGIAGAAGVAGAAGAAGAVGAPPLVRATRVAAGAGHTCAVLDTGQVACWGGDLDGELGNGTIGDGVTVGHPLPSMVPGIEDATDVATAAALTCVLSGGPVRCFGLAPGVSTAGPELVPDLDDATQIAVGEQFACALVSGGRVRCWGVGGWGSLGDGAMQDSAAPTQVAGITGATAIVADGLHACALGPAGGVWCWGFGAWGELGDGASVNRPVPVQVAGLSNVVAIAAGWDNTCAVRSDGTVWCWGRDQYGQLGDGTTADQSGQSTPQQLAISGATQVAIGLGHGCAIVDGGAVQCWGSNHEGSLGVGTSGQAPSTPAPVPDLSGVALITVGDGHTCALRADGSLRCWGGNGLGELGDGTTTPRTKPTPVHGFL